MGLKLNEGSDIATPLGGEYGSTSQTKLHHGNMEITKRQHEMVCTEEDEITNLSVEVKMYLVEDMMFVTFTVQNIL